MNPRIAILLTMLLSFFFAGCAANTPQGVAKAYYDDLRWGYYGSAYNLLSKKDRECVDKETFLRRVKLSSGPTSIAKVLCGVKEVRKIDEQSAVAKVHLCVPDIRKLTDEAMLESWFLKNDSGWSLRDELDQSEIKGENVHLECGDRPVLLVPEDGKWMLFVNDCRDLEINGLTREVYALIREEDYPAARARINEVLDLFGRDDRILLMEDLIRSRTEKPVDNSTFRRTL